jgi:hypothetical protein
MKAIALLRRSALVSLCSLFIIGISGVAPWLIGQTAAASLSVDKQVSKQSTSGTSVTTPAFSTSGSNELLVAFLGSDGPQKVAGQSFSSVTGGGLTWQLRERTNAQYGTAEIWTAAAPAVLNNATVQATHSGSYTASINVVAFIGANTTAGVGATGTGNGASGAQSASLTTTQAWAAGDDWDAANARTVGSGQTLQNQDLDTGAGDTYWTQSQANPSGTAGSKVTINDTAPTKDRWNLALLEIVPAVVDTTPPSVPQNLTATSSTPNQVSLSWSASTDNVSVAGYNIYRNGSTTALATGVTTTNYVDKTAVPSTNYTYTVSAYDASGNTSAQSSAASVTTGSPDTIPPTVSMSAPTNGSTVSGQVQVSAAATDNVSVSSVQFKQTNLATNTTTNIGSAITTSPYQTTWNTAALANGQYALSAVATDEAGNSATASPVDVTVANTASTAPTIDPSTPAATAVMNNVTSTTSPTFSPPANTVIYAVFSMDSASYEGTITSVNTVTNSGTPLTWHLLGRNNTFSSQAGGFLEVWWADNPTSQTNITSTATFSMATKNVSPPVGDFQILVMDNAAADQSSAAWSANTLLNSQNNAPFDNITTTKNNSQVFGVFDNWNNSETPVPGAGQSIQSIVLNTVDVDGYWIQKQNAPTPTAGTTVLMNATDPGQANQWRVLDWEVLGN